MTGTAAATPTKSSPFLRGERVWLRPLVESDVDGPYVNWFNDPDVCAWNSHHVYPYTRELALQYVRSVSCTERDLVLAIVMSESRSHVGNVALQGVDHFHRTAEFAIVIGDRRTWGQGVATEASRLILQHGFYELNLRRIGAGTFVENKAMRALARKLGMREEGIRREALFKRGAYHDVIEFGLLASDWAGAS